jgi:Short C-terminal domain
LLRAAAVGGAAYYAGKKVRAGLGRNAPEAAVEEEEPGAGLSAGLISRLRELSTLKAEGVLTQDEFEAEKQKILSS